MRLIFGILNSTPILNPLLISVLRVTLFFIAFVFSCIAGPGVLPAAGLVQAQASERASDDKGGAPSPAAELIEQLIAHQQQILADVNSVEIRYAAMGEPFETVRFRKEVREGEAVLVPDEGDELLAYFSFMQFLGDELRALLGSAVAEADSLNGLGVMRFTLDAQALRETPLLSGMEEAPLREAVFWIDAERPQLSGFRFRSLNRFGRTVELRAEYPRYETQRGFPAPAEIRLSMTGVYAQISDAEYAAELAELQFLLDNLDTFPAGRREQAERELLELKAELHRMAQGNALEATLTATGIIVR